MPERRATAAFPIGLILLAICAIFAYLAIGGAMLEGETETVVYTPPIADAPEPR
ncbi:membrane protein [Sinorhizobium meliloti]|nr:membrane protein [Sinorhizobium meliloti]